MESGSPVRGYPNQMDGGLEEELAVAERLGVEPLTPDDPRFVDLVENNDHLIWALDEERNLFLAPRSVEGQSLRHSPAEFLKIRLRMPQTLPDIPG